MLLVRLSLLVQHCITCVSWFFWLLYQHHIIYHVANVSNHTEKKHNNGLYLFFDCSCQEVILEVRVQTTEMIKAKSPGATVWPRTCCCEIFDHCGRNRKGQITTKIFFNRLHISHWNFYSLKMKLMKSSKSKPEAKKDRIENLQIDIRETQCYHWFIILSRKCKGEGIPEWRPFEREWYYQINKLKRWLIHASAKNEGFNQLNAWSL